MRDIGKAKIWSFSSDQPEAVPSTNSKVRSDSGLLVENFQDLVVHIAELQFRNPHLVLLFRGQDCDFVNRNNNTSLKPSLFRPERGKRALPSNGLLRKRFDVLHEAEQGLRDVFREENVFGKNRVSKYRIIRWAILQHYEVCFTPLLDVTHSLRIAASFASLGRREEVCLMALAVHQISGSISTAASEGLQVIRLNSVCPPSALRPHLQEGYLLGEYPEMADIDQKERYPHHEIDFGRRLIAKFRFRPASFWDGETFPPIPHSALYPDAGDPLFHLLEPLRDAFRDQD